MSTSRTGSFGTLTLIKGGLTEFFCSCCNKAKKSKTVVQWTRPDGTTTTCCNGCYGLMLSREPGAKR